MATPLAELVRKPAGTTETYVLKALGDKSPFLKRLGTYAKRANTRVSHKAARVVWDDDDTVSHMVVVKILRSGKKLRRRGRKST